MNEEQSLEYMDYMIERFCEVYLGTAIGESIKNRRENTWDDDYDGILGIYEDLEADGYV